MANTALEKALSGAKLGKAEMALLAALLGGAEDLNPEKGRTATTSTHTKPNILLPEGMSKLAASKELERQHLEEETIIEVDHHFNKWDFNDALVCTMRQMKETFGWVNAQTIQTFFGPIRPTEMQFQVGLTEQGVAEMEEGFLGQFGISPWDDAKGNIGVNRSGVVTVSIEVKKKYKERVVAFYQACEQRLSSDSIYKGKSVVFDKDDQGRLGFAFYHNQPNQHIFLNEDEELMVKNLVIAPMSKRTKRVMLFKGTYGTGKTESAMRVGHEGNQRGITFIYCKFGENFAKCLETAVQYQPAVIFLEDIDEQGSGEERDAKMNNLLNTLDGVQTKGKQVSVIFTTNHPNRINKALRRPGRIDVIVDFGLCTKETIKKIYIDRFQELPSGSQLDYDLLVEATPIAQGAVVAEICTRSVDTADAINDGHLTNDIVKTSIASMKVQLEFMKEDPEAGVDSVAKAAGILGRALGFDRLADSFDTLDNQSYAEAAKTLRG